MKDLKILLETGHTNFRIALGGTAGAIFSAKTITYDKKIKKYCVINWIDETAQELTEKELMDNKLTHIGEALKKNCLIVDLKNKK